MSDTSDTTQVGFSQRIQLDWLEHTATLALAGTPHGAIRRTLQEILRDRLSVGGEAKHSNREKAITILLQTWVTVPKELGPFRDDGLRLLQRLPEGDHLAIHWGMCATAYPFFGAVAQATGRLLHLQSTAAAAQVQRRLREQLGERETVARAARRILRGYIDWGVLEETGEKGVYQASAVQPVRDSTMQSWLIESLLRSSGNGSIPLAAVATAPMLFPFALDAPGLARLDGNRRLQVMRQGLDQDIVMLQDAIPSS